MNKVLLSILIALAISSIVAVNPGAVVGIREPILSQIKNQYYQIIMMGFEWISVGNVKSGSLELTGVTPDLDISGPEAVHLGFDKSRNALVVNVTDAGLNVHTNWKDSSSSKSGTTDVVGTLDLITMYMTFDATQVNETFRPKINFEEVNIMHSESKFDFQWTCSECSESLQQKLNETLRNDLFAQFNEEALEIVNLRISTIVNLQLETMYPDTFPLSGDISINVGLTDVIQVEDEFLAVPIDATIFLNEHGYNRPTEAPPIDFVNPNTPGDMLLFTSDYVFKCISIIMNKYPMHFEIPIYGTIFQINIDGGNIPFELESEEGHMRLVAGGNVTVPLWNAGVAFALESELDLNIMKGDSVSMLFIHPVLKAATFDMFKVKLWGMTFDLGHSVVPYLDMIIETVLDVVFFPKFNIPKLEALPITATEAELKFHGNFTELGFSFDF